MFSLVVDGVNPVYARSLPILDAARYAGRYRRLDGSTYSRVVSMRPSRRGLKENTQDNVLIISALILFLHLRPRDRLNGGIHPRHHQMAPTSLSTK